MSICFISPAAYPLLSDDHSLVSAGGAEAQFVTLGRELIKRDQSVHFIVDDYGQQKMINCSGIKVHKTSFRYMGGANAYLPIDWLKLLSCMKKINADIYLLKIPKDILLPVGFYCYLFGKKLVYIGQSDKDVDIPLLMQLQNKLAVQFYRTGLRLTDYAVAQTDIQQKGFIALGVNSQIIRNLITLPESNLSKDKYVLWVGNATENKQPEMYIRLAKMLPYINFKMIMSGNQDDMKFRDIQKHAETISNLDFIGFVPFSKISVFFSQAALLVSTSLREGFPNVFLQTWQYGTPVISLQVDPDNIIVNQRLGLVSKTEEQLLLDVETLMKDSKLYEEMGANSYQFVLENHSVSKVAELYEDLFSKLH